MPSLSFRKQFRQPIVEKRKMHTIRAKRKVAIKPGDTLYLFTGMRTVNCERIFVDYRGFVICTRVEDVEIGADKVLGALTPWIKVAGQLLDSSEREALAKADGFQDWPQMVRFWEGQLPFVGDIIHWKVAL